MPRQTPRSTLPGVGVVLLLISLFGCRSRNTPSSAPSASSSARPSPSFGTSPPPSASASARVSPTFVALQTQLT
ncbi:MAG: hypothetical protein ABI193_11190, partial [Minicystis sp.]